ncbi:MAG: ABC transporter ATP-binding protein, partial [Cyanobacteria bacterium J06607_6]
RIIAEQPTQALLQEFSGSTYHIEVEGALTPEQCRAITAVGGDVQETRIGFAGSPEALYTLLAVLKPLPILSVQRDRADLTQVFLKLVKDTQERT